MPEFLRNTNAFSLGVLNDGRVIDDVLLPPWADNSHEKFIRVNTEALESVLFTFTIKRVYVCASIFICVCAGPITRTRNSFVLTGRR